jgi:tRNA nucleotidyltransferase/poly(A) polymerase
MNSQLNNPSATLIARLRDVIDPAANAWLVGGVVRDQLAGKPCHDIDIILPGESRQIARRAADALGGNFFALDDTRGMYRILLTSDGQTDMVDFARFQAESLEDDLKLRDFTVNAMAMRLHDPTVWSDPLHGRQDLKDKILRPCSDQSFENDPVRTIRAARMSLAFNLRMAPGVISLIRAASPKLVRVSAERKRDEFLKLLDGVHPASAIRLLDSFEVLSSLLPELASLKGVSQSLPHTMPVWEHTLAVVSHLDQLLNLFLEPEATLKDGGNLMLGLAAGKLGIYRPSIQSHYQTRINPFRSRKSLGLLAALLHDIGKPSTISTGTDGRIHFYRHESVGAEIAVEIGRALALSEVETDALSVMTDNHMRPRSFSTDDTLPTRRKVFRFYQAAGKFGVDTCFLSMADSLAKADHLPEMGAWTDELDRIAVYLKGWFEEQKSWVNPVRLINGNEIMEIFNVQPGKIIGDVLDQVTEAQAAGEISTREEALEMAKVILFNPSREKDE